MKTTVTPYDFREGFRNMGYEVFSYDGLTALFDYLVEVEYGEGEEMEFSPYDLCCEFSEYTLEDLIDQHPELLEDIEDSACLDSWIEYFQDYTTVIAVDFNTIIIYDY